MKFLLIFALIFVGSEIYSDTYSEYSGGDNNTVSAASSEAGDASTITKSDGNITNKPRGECEKDGGVFFHAKCWARSLYEKFRAKFSSSARHRAEVERDTQTNFARQEQQAKAAMAQAQQDKANNDKNPSPMKQIGTAMLNKGVDLIKSACTNGLTAGLNSMGLSNLVAQDTGMDLLNALVKNAAGGSLLNGVSPNLNKLNQILMQNPNIKDRLQNNQSDSSSIFS